MANLLVVARGIYRARLQGCAAAAATTAVLIKRTKLELRVVMHIKMRVQRRRRRLWINDARGNGAADSVYASPIAARTSRLEECALDVV